jgi:alkylhydroperoxidase family enzyme
MAEISFVKPEDVEDPKLRAFFERAAREGTPRPEIIAIRAHQPDVLRTWMEKWDRVFKNGIADPALKELIRVRVSSSLECSY